MHVKIFEAADMTSGLNMVRKELGPDALIISTRTLKNGKLGLLGKPSFEITAASDSEPIRPKNGHGATHLPKNPAGYAHYQQSERLKSPQPANTAELQTAPKVAKINEVTPEIEPQQDQTPVQKIPQEFKEELDELKKLVQNLTGEVDRYGKKIEECNDTSSTTSLKTNYALENLFKKKENTEDPITDHLLSFGINLKNSIAISGEIEKNFGNDGQQSLLSIEEKARTVIERHLTPTTHNFLPSEGQKRIAFVGPTGVGKTTTLAKIAAQYLSKISNSIALITIDTYRIAAVEQLKVYGELMDLPVDVVINPRQLDQALFKHKDKDLILIDTAGRSPKDSFSFEELSTFFLPDFEIENHLVLSSTTREKELVEICRQFRQLNISQTIMTKIDECSELGVILNLQLETGLPLSYITNGQRVPEDLIEAAQHNIAELIIPISEGILHD